MFYSIDIQSQAQFEIDKAKQFYNSQSPELGDRFVFQIYETLKLIQKFPKMFQLIDIRRYLESVISTGEK